MLNKIIGWFSRAFLSPKRENLRVCGKVTLTGRDKFGNIQFVRTLPNLITNAGFDLIADVLGLNAQPVDITKMAIGDGTAGGTGATALDNQTDIQDATYAHTPGTKTLTFTATFTSVVAATEYGCLNATPTLLNTAGFTAISVDSLEIVCTITLS